MRKNGKKNENWRKKINCFIHFSSSNQIILELGLSS